MITQFPDLLKAILVTQAKAHGTTVEQQAERFLRAAGADDSSIKIFHAGRDAAVAERLFRAGLLAERQRILKERTAKRGGDVSVATQDEGDIIVEDPCSETYLRRVWGDNWEYGWWISSCSIFG